MHIVQQEESYRIPCPALLLQLGKLTRNLRTFTGGGIDVSSWHHYPGKTTQTPADCKPACDAPQAATCSLGDDSQWVLLKDRGQSCCPSSHSNSRSKNLQAKNKKITQQAKHWSQRKGKGAEQHADGSRGAFSFVFHQFPAVRVGHVLFSQSQNCCLSCLSCWSAGGDKNNFRIAQKQPSFTPFCGGCLFPVPSWGQVGHAAVVAADPPLPRCLCMSAKGVPSGFHAGWIASW